MKHKYKTSFEINKLISISGLFSRVKLPVSARLVLRAIADYWNYNRGEAFPTQKTLAYNTGLDERTVRSAVKTLLNENLLTAKLHKKRYYYQFSGLFTLLITGKAESNFINTGLTTLNKEDNSSANNIIKYYKNTSFLIPEEAEEQEPLSEIERCTMMIEQFKDNPALKPLVYQLTRKLETLTSAQES